MDISTIIGTFANALIAAAATATAALAAYGIRRLAEYLKNRTTSADAKRFIDEASDAISAAVAATSQTYVDALKAAGNFTKENQEKAAEAALETAKSLLAKDAADFIAGAYGSLDAYLKPKIEAEVRSQKVLQPATKTTKATEETTTVAATTAAATAAAVAQQAIMQQPEDTK